MAPWACCPPCLPLAAPLEELRHRKRKKRVLEVVILAAFLIICFVLKNRSGSDRGRNTHKQKVATDDVAQVEKNSYYVVLSSVLLEVKPIQKILMGNFNGRVSNIMDSLVVRRFGEDILNDSGEQSEMNGSQLFFSTDLLISILEINPIFNEKELLAMPLVW